MAEVANVHLVKDVTMHAFIYQYAILEKCLFNQLSLNDLLLIALSLGRQGSPG